MRSWSARFRRAAAVLLGLHLTQATALAAVAPCAVRFGAAASPPTAGSGIVAEVATDVAHDHTAMHHTSPSPSDDASSTPSNNHSVPGAPGSCSMAMACAVTASPSALVLLPTPRDRILTERVPQLVATRLPAITHPPEPPPPKS